MTYAVQWGGGSEGKSSQRVLFKLGFKLQKGGDFPGPVVKSLSSQCRGTGSIPGQGKLRSHMPHAVAK